METIGTATNPNAALLARTATGAPAAWADPERDAVVLTDGTVVKVRPIRPTDAAALRRFHRRLSERTVYQRFFAPLPELSEEQARYFTGVDGRQRVALVALDPNQYDELVAVVRFDREEGSDCAEYAAVVADGWQGRGLGRSMTQRLIAAAHSRGVARLYALVLPENTRMRGLLRDLGVPVRIDFDGSVNRIHLDLADVRNRSASASEATARRGAPDFAA